MSVLRDDSEFRKSIGSVVRFGTGASALISLAFVVPFTLWYGWAHPGGFVEPFLLSIFCAAFAWWNISIVRWQRYLNRLGWASVDRTTFGLGPRPADLDELEIWRRGTSLRYSFAAVILSMLAFGALKYLSGDF
jgi:hypothetical protein